MVGWTRSFSQHWELEDRPSSSCGTVGEGCLHCKVPQEQEGTGLCVGEMRYGHLGNVRVLKKKLS